MSAGAIVAWYNVINAGIRWQSGERGQSSHFWQDFQHILSKADTGGGPPCIQTMAPAWSSLEFYSIQLQGGDHLLVLTWKMKLHYISIVYLMACDLLIIMVAVGTMGVCFVWLPPLPLNISHPPLSVSSGWSPGPRAQARGASVYNNRILSQPATISILIIVPTLCVITQD